MKRITITLLLTLALALPTGAQDKPKKAFTARQAAMEMLRLANKISDSDLKGKSGVPPAGSDSLSAPTGHRSFLQIPPPLRVSLDGRAAKRFPVSPDF